MFNSFKPINLFLFITFLFVQIIFLIKIDIFGVISGSKSLLDFDNYFYNIKEMLSGINPYQTTFMKTLGPPLVILPFLPLSLFNLYIGRCLLTFINLSCLYTICYFISQHFYPKQKFLSFIILSTILFSSFPARLSIELGQLSLIITLFLTMLIINKNPKTKGFLISLIISIKTIYLTILVAFLRNRKVVFWSLIWLVIIVLVSLIFIKIEWYLYYFKQILSNTMTTSINIAGTDYYNQSLKSTIYRIGFSDYYQEVFWLFLSVSFFYLIVSKNLLSSIIIALTISPVAWQHYYVILFPLFLITFKYMEKNVFNTILFLISVFFWWTEFPFLHLVKLNWLSGIFASHYLLSALLLLILIIKNKINLSVR